MQEQNKFPTGAGMAPRTEVEIEIKLSGEPDALRRAFAAASIQDRATGRARTKRLENTYYDTEDQRLRARGLAFRVRKDGRHYYQTLKSNDAGGLAAYRGEWQNPLRSSEPDLALMPEGGRAALDGVVDTGELTALFATRVERTVRRIATAAGAGGPSVIEAALDLGSIEANGSSLPVAELELELLEGSPEALYALALELERLAPLRLETRSKSARGYALAARAPPAWHKAEAPALEGDATVDQAIQAILRNCLQQWCANEAAVLDGSDPEGVHQMRVALRRLRSAFSVFGRLFDPGQRARLSGEAKTIVNSLGPARDWDVFLSELLAPVRAARPDDPGLARLAEAAQAERSKGYAQALAAIGAPSYTRYVLELGHWIEARGWRAQATERGAEWLDRPIGEFAAHLLGKRQRKTLKLGRQFDRISAEERHRVRIALKKLRYAIEFFQTLYPKKDARPYLDTLKDLQDSLGHLNDVAVAERLIATLGDDAEAGAVGNAIEWGGGLVLGWHARGVAELEPATVRAWHEFAELEPFWRSIGADSPR
jgi:inorganic triphosphatase YgiF